MLKHLISADWHVRALVRPQSVHTCPKGVTVDWIAGCLEDTESLRRLVKGVHAVVHCAGAVRGISERDFIQTNVDGVARLVQASHEQDQVPRFLLISSLAAREPGLSYYAASKRRGEEILAYSAESMPWSVFRPTAVYGPGDRELMPIFKWMVRGIAPVIGTGRNRISFLYVEDLAHAVVCWLNSKTDSGHIYELYDGYPHGYSWQDVIEIVTHIRAGRVLQIKIPVLVVKTVGLINLMAGKIRGRPPMLTPGKACELAYPDWSADNTAITRDTGWTPRIGLEEGLKGLF